MTAFVHAFYAWPRAVASVLVTPPAAEPLTLAEAKLAAGLDWPEGDPRDKQMQGFIAAARQKVEQDTGLALLQQTRELTMTAGSSSLMPLPWQALPLQSITDPFGQRLTKEDVLIDRRLNVLRLPYSYSGEGTWTIVSGWPTPEALLQEAPLLWQAVALLTAHYATLGRDLAISGTIVAEVPMGYDDSIAPFRLMWVI